MKKSHKLLFTAISAALFAAGAAAILTQSRTVSGKYTGITELVGDQAVWHGKTCLILALLPLVVWIPKRFGGYYIALWWVGLMAWFFVPMFVPSLR